MINYFDKGNRAQLLELLESIGTRPKDWQRLDNKEKLALIREAQNIVDNGGLILMVSHDRKHLIDDYYLPFAQKVLELDKRENSPKPDKSKPELSRVQIAFYVYYKRKALNNLNNPKNKTEPSIFKELAPKFGLTSKTSPNQVFEIWNKIQLSDSNRLNYKEDKAELITDIERVLPFLEIKEKREAVNDILSLIDKLA